jgi:hypothetical protein
MKSARIRLLLATALFTLWIGYLAFLVWKTALPQVRFHSGLELPKTHYEVLSRSQFLEANLDVSARVDKDGIITEHEVLWSADGEDDKIVDGLNIKHALSACQLEGEGPFLVPLVRDRAGVKLAVVPNTPGYPSQRLSENASPQENTRDRVYRDTPDTRAQEREIRSHFSR